MDRIKKRFIGRIYKALRSQIKAFQFDAHYGLEFAQRRLTVQQLNTQIGKPIMDLYVSAGRLAAGKTKLTVREQKSKNTSIVIDPALYAKMVASKKEQQKALTMGRNEVITSEIRRYFQQHLFDKVVLPISETTQDIILKAIIKGQNEGWSVSRILTEIGRTDISRMRARRIVRTETVRATNFGALLSAFNEPFEMTKEWVAVNDNRTRHTHYNIDGQVRDLTKPFSNGLMFPGDPNGSAAEVISCRCSLAFRAKKDARGNLIPKPVPASAGGGVSVMNSLVDVLLGLAISNLIENAFEQ